MDARELAVQLHGREYRDETTDAEEYEAKLNGLVIVFGASDDLMEFRGAVNDEIGAWEGATAYFTKSGLLVNECDNEDCPHFKRLMKAASTIDAKWDTEGYSWVYETTIPHVSFDILEDGEKYCRGIVFALSDVTER
jgi:hypothetical protein